MKVLFLYLSAFSTNGGIEQFNKAFMKALSERVKLFAISSHDEGCDTRYIPLNDFKGYSGNKVLFSLDAVKAASGYDQIIIGHINLAPVGYIIKKIFPQKKLTLIAHGIEVWKELSVMKSTFLSVANEIITVSNFTKEKLINIHKVPEEKIKILPNTIDPYFRIPVDFNKPDYLLEKYNIKKTDKVILTICRLSSEERYKGYDKVIKALASIDNENIKYVLAGKYDMNEKERVDNIIHENNLQEKVILTGFIPGSELTDHYKVADLFAMPSTGEGFGIVYLEALTCGLPIITGNKDASCEILDYLPYGLSIDENMESELIYGITSLLNNNGTEKVKISESVQELYGFEKFKERVEMLLQPEKETITV